jgi:large subunit ribosomal protein L9
MKVLLMRDVDKLGHAGDVKTVANGYARNYLIQQGLATVATPGAVKQAETIRRSEGRRQSKLADDARTLAEQLEQVTLVFQVRASEAGKLFGSITTRQIVEALEAQAAITIDKRKLDIREPIRNLGLHSIRVHLARELNPHFKVRVERESLASATASDELLLEEEVETLPDNVDEVEASESEA